MEAKNIKEAKQLVRRYETISLKKIEEAFIISSTPANCLTGFSSPVKCVLCIKVGYNKDCYPLCEFCIYEIDHGCFRENNAETYDNISNATIPSELFKAYWLRAKHIRQIINYYE